MRALLDVNVLIALLDAAFAAKTRAEWAEIFDTIEDMWWAPVQDLEEVIADAQARAAGGFVEVPDEGTAGKDNLLLDHVNFRLE